MNLHQASCLPASFWRGLLPLTAADAGAESPRPGAAKRPKPPRRGGNLFSSSILKVSLIQRQLSAEVRQALIDAFRFGSPQWALLDEVELPARLPPTGDPVLLALRRLIRKDTADLGVDHRQAFELAEIRPGGLRRLVFEEAVKADAESGATIPGAALEIYLAHFSGGSRG